MARNFYNDTMKQNFWKESIKTEATTRLNSYLFPRGQSRNKSCQFEVYHKRMEETKPSDSLLERLPSISVTDKIFYPMKKVDYNEVYDRDRIMTDDELLNIPIMRSPSPHVRKSMYDGLTREGKGRHFYLRQRYEKNPEEKFPLPVCTSWDYGWRLSDVMKKEDTRKPEHGSYMILKHTLYTRNGLLNGCDKAH